MELTGLQNPLVKAAAELKQKKYRQQRGEFLAEGLRTAEEAVAFKAAQQIFYTATEDERTLKLLEQAASMQLKLTCVSEAVMKKLLIQKRRRALLLSAVCRNSRWNSCLLPVNCCWYWTE